MHRNRHIILDVLIIVDIEITDPAGYEEAVLDKCIELVEKLAGRRPTGYVAPWWEFSSVTNELLLQKGIKYDHSLMHDDFHPYYVRVGDTWTKIDYSKKPEDSHVEVW